MERTTIHVGSVSARLFEDEDGEFELVGWDKENEKWDRPLAHHEVKDIMLAIGKMILAAHKWN